MWEQDVCWLTRRRPVSPAGRWSGYPDRRSVSTSEQPLITGPVDIAVLDDDLDFRNYLEDFLRDEGMYSVRAYAHPEDLIRDVEQRVPDILLLDMKMGEFRREKVLEQLL